MVFNFVIAGFLSSWPYLVIGKLSMCQDIVTKHFQSVDKPHKMADTTGKSRLYEVATRFTNGFSIAI